jgi:hypothetical protein
VSGFETTREAEATPTAAPTQALETQPLPGVELVRSLSRSAGNRAVTALLQRHGAHVANRTSSGSKTTWAQVEADLSFSAYGWEAMGILKDNKIKLDLSTSGPVAGFAPDQNRCFINLSMPSYEIAAYFVHEMYHASQFHGGRSPGAKTKAEDPWVAQMVTEEVEGTVKGFMHKLSLERFGRAPANDTPAGMNRFRGAYEYAYKQAIGEGLEPGEAKQRGLANGAKMIRWMFKRPSKRLSAELQPNQFETYEEYYRREWSQQNAPKPKPSP